MGSCDCSFSLVSTNSQALVLSYSTRILWTSPLYDSCWLTGPLLVCHTYSALSSSFCLFVHIVVLTLDLFSKFCLSRVVQFSRSRFCHRWLHFHFCPSFGHFFHLNPDSYRVEVLGFSRMKVVHNLLALSLRLGRFSVGSLRRLLRKAMTHDLCRKYTEEPSCADEKPVRLMELPLPHCWNLMVILCYMDPLLCLHLWN